MSSCTKKRHSTQHCFRLRVRYCTNNSCLFDGAFQDCLVWKRWPVTCWNPTVNVWL